MRSQQADCYHHHANTERLQSNVMRIDNDKPLKTSPSFLIRIPTGRNSALVWGFHRCDPKCRRDFRVRRLPPKQETGADHPFGDRNEAPSHSEPLDRGVPIGDANAKPNAAGDTAFRWRRRLSGNGEQKLSGHLSAMAT